MHQERLPHQGRQGAGLHRFHDLGPAGFDGADAPPQLVGDLAVRLALEQQFEHVAKRRRELAVQSVHGYIVAEHGDTEIPLWSTTTIGGVPVQSWEMPGHGPLTADDEQKILHGVRNSAEMIIRGKGATNYAIGLAGSTILQALLWNEHRVLPVSSLLTDYRGIGDVCISVPSVVGHQGVERLLPVPMNAEEVAGLRASADSIRNVIRTLGF